MKRLVSMLSQRALLALTLLLLVTPVASAQNAALRAAFERLPAASDIATQLRLLPHNEEAWYARWKMIESARSTIDATYFIVSKDVFGQAFLGHLLEKAKRGVKVRLMIDWRISYSAYMRGVYDKLQEMARNPNVEIRLYNSAVKSLLALFSDPRQLVAANHDKIMIVDGQVAITGGRNIGADYFAGKGEFEIVYRDTDVVLRGASVCGALKQAFDVEWTWSRNSPVRAERLNLVSEAENLRNAYVVMSRYLVGQPLPSASSIPWTSPLQRRALAELLAEIGKYKALSRYAAFQLFTTEPRLPVKIVDKRSRVANADAIGPMLLSMIDAARTEILIQNPYVVLTTAAEAALARAAARGVKIVFHSNSGGSTDNLFPQAFLGEDLVRIFRTMPGVRFLVAPDANSRLHSKTFVFDGQVVVVGSFNMDPLSAEVNSEIVSVALDAAFGQSVRTLIYNDAKTALEYKVTFDAAGKVQSYYGPENHLSKDVLDKMRRIRALKLLRPII